VNTIGISTFSTFSFVEGKITIPGAS